MGGGGDSMKHSLVDQLNRYLGEETGLMLNGKPEYCWQWAPDLPYWKTRFGRCWVMCRWGLPQFDAQWWRQQFGTFVPYPANGMYHPFGDSALGPGSVPTWHLTQNYAWAINKQRGMSEIQHAVNCENEIAEHHHKREVEFRQMVQDEAPAFGNCKSLTSLPGDKPHVVFGGLLDSKGEPVAAATA